MMRDGGWRCAAEIGALDGRIGLQLIGGAVPDDDAVLEHIAAVGDPQALLRVLLDEQEPDAGLAHPPQALRTIPAP